MKGEYALRNFICVGCGKEVETRRDKSKVKFCSLECYRLSARPTRKTGEFVNCYSCGKEVYKSKCHLKSQNFCSNECHNVYQKKSRVAYSCRMCEEIFYWSKSRATQTNPLYCSWDCRLKDKEHILQNSVRGNLCQQTKKGLNKLELAGRSILEDIGVDFEEQRLMFGKFLVDVLVESKKLVIQWDGVYWHTREDRVWLDKGQDAYLNKCGYQVLRVTDKDIKHNLEGVYADIRRAIQ